MKLNIICLSTINLFVERIGSDIDIIDEFMLKYDVAAICHSSNTVVSVVAKAFYYSFIAFNKWINKINNQILTVLSMENECIYGRIRKWNDMFV